MKNILLFKNKNYLLFFLGQLVSNAGNAIYIIVVTWFLLDKFSGSGDSGLYISFFVLSSSLPQILLGSFAGVFVDRLSKKKIMIGTDIGRGLVMILLAYLIRIEFNLTILLVCSVIISIHNALFSPAVDAIIRELVKTEDISEAVTTNKISQSITYILGSMIAGLMLMQFGLVGILFINGISFLLSALSEFFIKIEIPLPKERIEGKDNDFKKEFLQVFMYNRQEPFLLRILLVTLIANFFISAFGSVIIPKTGTDVFNMNPKEFGFLEMGIAAGSLVGMIFVQKIISLFSETKIVVASIILQSVMLLIGIIPMSLSYLSGMGYLYIATLFLFMVGMSFLNIPFMTYFQREVDQDIKGRFFGVMTSLMQGLTPLAIMIFGVLSDKVNLVLFSIAISLVLLLMLVMLKTNDGFESLNYKESPVESL